MGTTAADVQRDIERLRGETDLLITELQSRLHDATNVRAQVEHHPIASGGVGLALLSGLSFAGYAVYQRVHKERKPTARPRQRISESGASLWEKGKETRQAAPSKIEKRSDRGMLKRVLYAGMTAAMVTIAALAARQLAKTIWSKTMEERPPTLPQV